MGVLESLKDKLNIKEDEYNEYEEAIKSIEKEINSNGIYFDSQVRIGFYSHMVSFIRRLKKKEMVDGADDADVVAQISKENMELSKALIEPLCEKYDIKANDSEIVLIAIYLESSHQINIRRSYNGKRSCCSYWG